jgi:hypothetical protein
VRVQGNGRELSLRRSEADQGREGALLDRCEYRGCVTVFLTHVSGH